MTPEHAWELIAILAAGLLGWWSRRSGDREQDERKTREAQAGRLGERIGTCERRLDLEEGRRAGREEANRERDGR